MCSMWSVNTAPRLEMEGSNSIHEITIAFSEHVVKIVRGTIT